MESHTMSSQAEADAGKRHFKREVSYRSVRATTHRAFTTFRKKVEEMSGPLKRRPLEQLENEDSPRAPVRPKRLPSAPLKRSAAPSPLSSPRHEALSYLGPGAELKTPGRGGGTESEVSDFGDSPALFEYREAPTRRFPAALRRSVRSLVARRRGLRDAGAITDTPSPASHRLIRKRASKNLARRRIHQLASPKSSAPPASSSNALTNQLNDLVANIAALRPRPTTPKLH